MYGDLDSWQLGMSEQTGVSEDLDSEGCLSSIKSSTKERNWSEPERIQIPQSEKLFVVVVVVGVMGK